LIHRRFSAMIYYSYDRFRTIFFESACEVSVFHSDESSFNI